jgi:hypothetical protein
MSGFAVTVAHSQFAKGQWLGGADQHAHPGRGSTAFTSSSELDDDRPQATREGLIVCRGAYNAKLKIRDRFRSPLARFLALYAALYAAFGVQSPYLPSLLDSHGLPLEGSRWCCPPALQSVWWPGRRLAA